MANETISTASASAANASSTDSRIADSPVGGTAPGGATIDKKIAAKVGSGDPERAEAVAQAAGKPAVLESINISEKKGERKTPVDAQQVMHVKEQYGIEGDAHAGDWHRQVSFLAQESIDRVRAAGLDVSMGDFAENFTTVNLDCMDLPLGTQLRIGDDVLVEISQIGKVCHAHCAIYYLAGDCIFPREGIFGVVLHGGDVKVGDPIIIEKIGDGTCAYAPADAQTAR